MTTRLLLFVFAVALVLQTVPAAGQFSNDSIPYTYEAKVIESSNGTCPTAEDWEAVRNEIRDEIQMLLIGGHMCGGTSGWTRIAYLDMSDSSHQCPGDLIEITREGLQLCGRADPGARICTSVTFPIQDAPRYSTVCGRVVAYLYGEARAFGGYTGDGADNTIDEYYVDGVTLTHGPVGAREHIWSFVSGREEIPGSRPQDTCPCVPNANPSIVVPPFIGENYFCESGTINFHGTGRLYDDPLWDGDGCSEGNSCCTFNNPPYFTRQLPASTSDDIELRDCGYWPTGSGHSNSDTLIQFIELYVK